MRKTVNRIIAFIVLLSAVFGCSSCQPTPDAPPVTSKTDQSMDKAMNAGADEDYMFTAPESYSCDELFCDGLLNVKAENAKVEASSGTYPLYSAKRVEFERLKVAELAQFFFGDAVLYKHTDEMTKAQIQKDEVIPLKQAIEQLECGELVTDNSKNGLPLDYVEYTPIYDDNGNFVGNEAVQRPITVSEQLEIAREYLKSATDRMNKAPDTIQLTEIDLATCNMNRVEADAIADDSKIGTLNLTDRYLHIVKGKSPYAFVPGAMQLFGEPIENANCRRAADALCRDIIGLDDFALTECRGNYDSEGGLVDSYTILYLYTRKVGDYAVFADEVLSQKGETRPEFDEGFRYEYVLIAVDSRTNEVTELTWSAPLEVTLLQSSVELKDFYEFAQSAIDRIGKSVYIAESETMKQDEYGRYYTFRIVSKYDKQVRFDIDAFELGYTQVRKINSDEYLLIPAWCIRGQKSVELTEEGQKYANEHGILSRFEKHYHDIVFNAIDGSLVDKTYNGY